jgi:hypothetical protein
MNFHQISSIKTALNLTDHFVSDLNDAVLTEEILYRRIKMNGKFEDTVVDYFEILSCNMSTGNRIVGTRT